jgi:hypothetical protein
MLFEVLVDWKLTWYFPQDEHSGWGLRIDTMSNVINTQMFKWILSFMRTWRKRRRTEVIQ